MLGLPIREDAGLLACPVCLSDAHWQTAPAGDHWIRCQDGACGWAGTAVAGYQAVARVSPVVAARACAAAGGQDRPTTAAIRRGLHVRRIRTALRQLTETPKAYTQTGWGVHGHLGCRDVPQHPDGWWSTVASSDLRDLRTALARRSAAQATALRRHVPPGHAALFVPAYDLPTRVSGGWWIDDQGRVLAIDGSAGGRTGAAGFPGAWTERPTPSVPNASVLILTYRADRAVTAAAASWRERRPASVIPVQGPPSAVARLARSWGRSLLVWGDGQPRDIQLARALTASVIPLDRPPEPQAACHWSVLAADQLRSLRAADRLTYLTAIRWPIGAEAILARLPPALAALLSRMAPPTDATVRVGRLVLLETPSGWIHADSGAWLLGCRPAVHRVEADADGTVWYAGQVHVAGRVLPFRIPSATFRADPVGAIERVAVTAGCARPVFGPAARPSVVLELAFRRYYRDARERAFPLPDGCTSAGASHSIS